MKAINPRGGGNCRDFTLLNFQLIDLQEGWVAAIWRTFCLCVSQLLHERVWLVLVTVSPLPSRCHPGSSLVRQGCWVDGGRLCLCKNLGGWPRRPDFISGQQFMSTVTCCVAPVRSSIWDSPLTGNVSFLSGPGSDVSDLRQNFL